MTTSERLYQALLLDPGNTDRMLVLADALDDEGHGLLAAAYRWAGERGKWPFVRHARQSDVRRHGATELHEEIYDWDREDRKWVGKFPLPKSAELPRNLFDGIRWMLDRQYGDVNAAFILLANALAGNKEFQPMTPWSAEVAG